MVLIFCLRIRMSRLSEGLILHVRQHKIVWKYILIWTYSGTEEAELWQSRQSRSAFTSLGMKADLKCETTDLLQSRQKGSVEAELPIVGTEGRVLVEKPILRSLAVKIERKCRNETANLWKSRQRWNAEAELHIFGSPGRTSAENGTSDLCQSRQSGSAGAELHVFGSQGRAEVQKCGSGISHFWQSMQNESADVELQIFGSQSRVDMRNRNIRSLAVKAEQKCGSGISDLKPSRQSGSAVKHFDSPVKLDVRKQILTALTGSYPTDCHCKCWRISLLTAILKDNVKTMCG